MQEDWEWIDSPGKKKEASTMAQTGIQLWAPKEKQQNMQGNSCVIHLNNASIPCFRVHPVVVISILDHYQRRDTQAQKPKQVDRVIGCLLGRVEKNKVFITNTFPIPYEENLETGEVALETEYMDQMEDVHARMNVEEMVVGWYATSNEINYVNGVVHKAIKERALHSGYTKEPIFITVDAQLTGSRLVTRGYCVDRIALPDESGTEAAEANQDAYSPDDNEIIYQFKEVPLQLTSSTPEKIGIDTLIKGKPLDDRFDSPARVVNDIESLEQQLVDLELMIEEISTYADKVTDEDGTEPDIELGYMIANALQSVPELSPDHYQQVFSTASKDLLMMLYISNLTQVQVSIANKMNGILAVGNS